MHLNPLKHLARRKKIHGRHLPSGCSIDPIVKGRPVCGSRGTSASKAELSNVSNQFKSSFPPLAAISRVRGDSVKLGRAGAGGAGRSGFGISSEYVIIRSSDGSWNDDGARGAGGTGGAALSTCIDGTGGGARSNKLPIESNPRLKSRKPTRSSWGHLNGDALLSMTGLNGCNSDPGFLNFDGSP